MFHFPYFSFPLRSFISCIYIQKYVFFLNELFSEILDKPINGNNLCLWWSINQLFIRFVDLSKRRSAIRCNSHDLQAWQKGVFPCYLEPAAVNEAEKLSQNDLSCSISTVAKQNCGHFTLCLKEGQWKCDGDDYTWHGELGN